MRKASGLFDLTGHVALVTGGNGGIGLGMAEGLAAQGASIAIWGTNPAKNDGAVEQLSALGVDVHAVVCDVGDQDAVVASMAETIGELGRVDSCFVNAGIGGAAPSFLEMTVDEWRRVLRVNLDGAFYTAQEATRHMVERFEAGDTAGGSLVFTTSGSAYFGQQKGQHYGASKAGMIAMMRGIAVEHARHGVRANAVLPGWIESDMTAGALTWDSFVERNLPRVPMRRWGDRRTSPASPSTWPARPAGTRRGTSSRSTAATTASDPSDPARVPAAHGRSMSSAEALLLLVAGIAGGLSGSIAGLASLATYPALLAGGLPPVTANITNTVALVFSSIGSVSAVAARADRAAPHAAADGHRRCHGGILGAALLLVTPGDAFELVVPWLIGLASVAILVRRPLIEVAVADAHVHVGRPGTACPATC